MSLNEDSFLLLVSFCCLARDEPRLAIQCFHVEELPTAATKRFQKRKRLFSLLRSLSLLSLTIPYLEAIPLPFTDRSNNEEFYLCVFVTITDGPGHWRWNDGLAVAPDKIPILQTIALFDSDEIVRVSLSKGTAFGR